MFSVTRLNPRLRAGIKPHGAGRAREQAANAGGEEPGQTKVLPASQGVRGVQGGSQRGQGVQGESQEGEEVQGESQEGEEVQGESQEGEEVQGESQEGEEVQGESQEDEEVQGESQDEEVQGESQEDEEVQAESQEDEEVQGERGCRGRARRSSRDTEPLLNKQHLCPGSHLHPDQAQKELLVFLHPPSAGKKRRSGKRITRRNLSCSVNTPHSSIQEK
ncbi:hypothetical protein NQZ68_014683 [Dissostichus eleginoides]|nr:hypothetical protein NQZ68_014683 [Dissostichus eleginoides]